MNQSRNDSRVRIFDRNILFFFFFGKIDRKVLFTKPVKQHDPTLHSISSSASKCMRSIFLGKILVFDTLF